MNRHVPIPSWLLASALLAVPSFAQAEIQEKAPPPPKITVALAQSEPVGMLQSLADHMKSGKAVALWAAIDPADRTKIQGLVQGLATKVDPAVYDEVVGLVGKLAGTLKKNAAFVAKNPMLNQSGETPEKVQKQVQEVVDVLEAMTKSPLGSHAALAKVDLEQFMATSGEALMSKFVNLAESQDSGMPSFADVEFGEPEIEGDRAVVEVSSKEEESTDQVKLKRVDGKWWLDVSEELADAAKELEGMPKMTPQDAMQARAVVSMVAPMLKRFDDCESQEDFDEAVQQSFGMFMGMMMGGMGGEAPGGR